MLDTKDRIAHTAARLFADNGYAATSLRQVIAEAGVNLAAVHYHFGSKEDLLDHLVGRLADPINRGRIAMLDRLEAEAAGAPLTVEQILNAFLAPAVEIGSRHPEAIKLMGRLYAEGMIPSLVERHFKPTGKRFVAALRRALPDLPDQEFFLRVDFMIGAMSHTLVHTQVIGPRLDAVKTEPDAAAPHGGPVVPGVLTGSRRLACLITFLSAGFRASATRAEERVESWQ